MASKFITPGYFVVRSLKLLKQFQKRTVGPQIAQQQTLFKLIQKSRDTAFGKKYDFDHILSSEDFIKAFQEKIPFHTYSEMKESWWHRSHNGEANVTWPGKINYFAMSSGTSDAASKHIPVTKQMLKSVRKVGIAQLYSLLNFKIPAVTFQKNVLLLGGTTSLNSENGYYEGDMSGISTINMPFWMSNFYFKPGQKIAKDPSWQDRIDQIVQHANKWDIGMICGVPSWVQIVLEKIIEHHKVQHIHEIWPNLNVYIHGGVSFDHYRENFKKLLGKSITYIETYMASEGSFGFKTKPGNYGIKLVLNAGIFFEFIPFTSSNFDDEGNLKSSPDVYAIEEVKENTNYAVVVSTCAGAWRYLIGDVIRFTSAKECEVAIVGRTKQFLNLCGEHVSIDNINKAINTTIKKLNISIGEFAVSGIKHENLFAYQWYIGCDDTITNVAEIKKILDETLCTVNDDYRIERLAAIKDVSVEVFPNEVFHGYLKWINKEGGMNKFPRVLKNDYLTNWEEYLRLKKIKRFSSSVSIK